VPDIVLCAINARYIHSSLALRSLHANLGVLRERATILEVITAQRGVDIAEMLLALQPKIIGISVAIWNAQLSLELVQLLRALAPEVVVVLGGPEVSHELHGRRIVELANYVIAGEGEVAFRELCEALLAGDAPAEKVIVAKPPDLSHLELPYGLYDDEDIAQRVIYVEASRGCPFGCTFCLSALDPGVRYFPEEQLFGAFSSLLERGARRFKFVDRTFNLNTRRAVRLLDFFSGRREKDLFVHLEAVPQRLPEPLVEALKRFGPGQVQLELGVQSLDTQTLERIGIRRNRQQVLRNIERLAVLGVHCHADLIGGLPGESLDTFAQGFDRLWETGVNEIQLGILKRLYGAPISGEPSSQGLLFAEHPPYEVLRSDAMTFETLAQLKRVAHLWDRVGNSGNFTSMLPLVEKDRSIFWGLWELTGWVFAHEGRVHSIALDRLAVLLGDYLVEERGLERASIASMLIDEYRRAGRKLPKALRPFAAGVGGALAPQASAESGADCAALPSRQARHRKGRGG